MKTLGAPWVLGIAAFVVSSAAPTAGDIGGCGQQAALLDDAKFFAQKARIDCDRCQTCGFASETCELACEGDTGETFPAGCQPLVHDGEVCLRALTDADCDDYASYVVDQGATTPTECAFCPLRSETEAE
jgi:hypothetical protein